MTSKQRLGLIVVAITTIILLLASAIISFLHKDEPSPRNEWLESLKTNIDTVSVIDSVPFTSAKDSETFKEKRNSKHKHSKGRRKKSAARRQSQPPSSAPGWQTPID